MEYLGMIPIFACRDGHGDPDYSRDEPPARFAYRIMA
jgi:hypothetical protein